MDNIYIAIVFNLGILIILCQKEPQEHGWGGEGRLEGNIGGEVGSIEPYPTFIPPGNRNIFCQIVSNISRKNPSLTPPNGL